MNAIPEFGETFDILASRGEPTVAMIPARLWDTLPAELRELPVQMIEPTKARLVPIALFKERFLDPLEDQLDVEVFDRVTAAAARDKAARVRGRAEPTIPLAIVKAEIARIHPIAAWPNHRATT